MKAQIRNAAQTIDELNRKVEQDKERAEAELHMQLNETKLEAEIAKQEALSELRKEQKEEVKELYARIDTLMNEREKLRERISELKDKSQK